MKFGSKYSGRFVAIAISVLLVLSILPPFFVSQQKKTQIKDQLDQATFTVNSIDILDSIDSTILANGSVIISGIDLNEIGSVTINSLLLTLRNGSETLPEVEIPLNNQQLGTELSFEIELFISDGSQDDLTSTILTNILVGTNFTLQFDAIIKYQIGPFVGSFSFSNIVYFKLEQEAVTVELEEIELGKENGSQNYISFVLNNPFTATMSLQGQVDVKTNIKLGTMQLNRTEFPTGTKEVRGSFDIFLDQAELYQNTFSSINTGFTIASELILGLNDLQVSISPELSLTPPEKLLDFSITSIEELDLDFDNRKAYVNASANITSYLPLMLKMERFSSEIYTLGNQKLGDLQWCNRSVILLSSSQSQIFRNITLQTTILNVVDISSVLLEGRIELKNIRVGLQIQGDSYLLNMPDQALNVVSG